MTEAQTKKLEAAKDLIESALLGVSTNQKVVATWLSVAGDYCKEVAEKLTDEGG